MVKSSRLQVDHLIQFPDYVQFYEPQYCHIRIPCIDWHTPLKIITRVANSLSPCQTHIIALIIMPTNFGKNLQKKVSKTIKCEIVNFLKILIFENLKYYKSYCLKISFFFWQSQFFESLKLCQFIVWKSHSKNPNA